jgi:hypothetical protein
MTMGLWLGQLREKIVIVWGWSREDREVYGVP